MDDEVFVAENTVPGGWYVVYNVLQVLKIWSQYLRAGHAGDVIISVISVMLT